MSQWSGLTLVWYGTVCSREKCFLLSVQGIRFRIGNPEFCLSTWHSRFHDRKLVTMLIHAMRLCRTTDTRARPIGRLFRWELGGDRKTLHVVCSIMLCHVIHVMFYRTSNQISPALSFLFAYCTIMGLRLRLRLRLVQ